MTTRSDRVEDITQSMHEGSIKDDKYCSNKAQVKTLKALSEVILPKLITKMTKEACHTKMKSRLLELHQR